MTDAIRQQYPTLLGPAEERSLLAELSAARDPGDRQRYLQLRERLVLANLRLVRAIARRYARNEEETAELMQVGTIGLLKAIDRYDPARANGSRFATPAGWWIRAAIGETLKRRREVPTGVLDWLPARDEPEEPRDPVDVERLLRRATPRQRQVLEQRYGLAGHAPASRQEVARRLGITWHAVDRLRLKGLERIRLMS